MQDRSTIALGDDWERTKWSGGYQRAELSVWLSELRPVLVRGTRHHRRVDGLEVADGDAVGVFAGGDPCVVGIGSHSAAVGAKEELGQLVRVVDGEGLALDRYQVEVDMVRAHQFLSGRDGRSSTLSAVERQP